LRIGTSKVKITPPVGSPLAGYSNRTSFSTGVADDLFARSLFLDDGKVRLAIVTCDLIGILPEFTKRVRSEAGDLGIPPDGLMVAAFHTHSGPTPDLGYAGMDRYAESLDENLARGVVRAASDRGQARFGYSSTEVHGLTVNRRNPENGATDPELAVISWSSDGGLPAHLINYSCHAVTLGPDNTLISADYPGYLMASIEARTGSVCLFTNGACGDVNPLTRTLKARMERGEDVYDRRGGTFEEAERMGRELGLRALDALEETAFKEVDLACASKTIRLEAHSPLSPEEASARVSHLKGEISALEARGAPPDELYRTGLELAFSRRLKNTVERGFIEIPIQAIRIGGVVLVGIPGELFVEIGLEIKDKAHDLGYKGLVVELANDYLSYLPTPSAFEKGGYEVEIARELGFGEELRDSILEGVAVMLEAMQ
jgi:neutral ceramidase